MITWATFSKFRAFILWKCMSFLDEYNEEYSTKKNYIIKQVTLQTNFLDIKSGEWKAIGFFCQDWLSTELALIRQHMSMFEVEFDGHLSHSLVTWIKIWTNLRIKDDVKWHSQNIKLP